MAYFPLVLAPRDDAHTQQTSARLKRSVFRHFLDAVIASRQRQADREIVDFLQGCGGKLTDDAEREIERRFLWRSSGQL